MSIVSRERRSVSRHIPLRRERIQEKTIDSLQQQQAEADQARQREIDRIIDELGNMDIEGFAADKNRKRNRA